MGKMTVVGVGLAEEQLTLGACALLKSGVQVILHTERGAVALWLHKSGIAYEALDFLYESTDDFDEHARAAAAHVMEAAKRGDVAYCVFDVRDESARLLIMAGAQALPGPPLEGALWGRASGETLCASASDWEGLQPDASRAALIREIGSRTLASEVKLRLMEAYPHDAPADVLTGGGVARIPLYRLDRLGRYDHETAALIYPEVGMARRPRLTMRDLQALVRADAKAYAPEEYGELCALATRLAGAAAYAEDRGEYSIHDILTDACRNFMTRG